TDTFIRRRRPAPRCTRRRLGASARRCLLDRPAQRPRRMGTRAGTPTWRQQRQPPCLEPFSDKFVGRAYSTFGRCWLRPVLRRTCMRRRTFLRRSTSWLSLGATLAMTKPLPAEASENTFAEYQAKRRKERWALLGDLPERRTPKAKALQTVKHDGFTLEQLELDLNGVEPVPADLVLP